MLDDVTVYRSLNLVPNKITSSWKVRLKKFFSLQKKKSFNHLDGDGSQIIRKKPEIEQKLLTIMRKPRKHL